MKERQVSFAGGELAPTLWGRTDLDRYPVGARTLLNFFVNPHGVLMNRPGTRHLTGEVKAFSPFSPLADGYKKRVIPFVFAEDDVCLLEVHAYAIAVYALDGATGLTHVFTLYTLYAEADLDSVRYAQVGNYVYFVAAGYAPLKATRVGGVNTTWTMETIDFEVPIPPKSSTEPAVFEPFAFFNTYAPGASGLDLPVRTLDTEDAAHPAREWRWAVTRIMRDSAGRLYETMPRYVTRTLDNVPSTPAGGAAWPGFVVGGLIRSSFELYPDTPQTIAWWTQPVTAGYNDDALVATRVYRGRSGLFGYVGETTGTYFVDDGADPDFSNPPPQGFNPFKVYSSTDVVTDGVHSEAPVRTESPQALALFQGRLYLGATEQRPNLVEGSAVDAFTNMDDVSPPDDSDALSFQLQSDRSEPIRAIISHRRLVLLTLSGVWVATGADGGELVTPNSIAAHKVSNHGCGKMHPTQVNDTIFYMQAKGTVPRALVLNDQDNPRVIDVSIYAKHLFDGYEILDWAYAEEPFSILWVVRSDGALLSLTYVPEQQMLAWARHEIEGATVESICVLPQRNEDADFGAEDYVFLVVNRGGVRSIERLASRIVDQPRYSIFLDSSVTHQGYAAMDGKTLTLTDSYSTAGAIETLVQAVISADAGSYVGRTVQIETSDGTIIRLKLTAWDTDHYDALVLANVALLSDLFGTALTGWAMCADSVTGLDHLEGQTVKALCDGNVVDDLVVTAGAVVLPDPAAIAHVGMAYSSDLESLAAINERGRKKTVSAVRIEVEGTRGGYVGPSLDDLKEVPSRDVSDSYGTAALRREEVKVNIRGQWTEQAYTAYRQAAPLPCTLLGITRDVVYGGD